MMWSKYIRILLTNYNQCQLNCIYCHKEGVPFYVGEKLGLSKYEKIAEALSILGVDKIKITGAGEPLLHPDHLKICSLFSQAADELSITTNGILLPELSSLLKEAGVTRINCSLDSVNVELYKQITGANSHVFNKVLDGIDSAINAALIPVKINVVVTKYNVTSEYIDDIIEFGKNKSVTIRFLEYFDKNYLEELYFPIAKIEKYLVEKYSGSPLLQFDSYSRKNYMINGCQVEFVKSLCNEFCFKNNFINCIGEYCIRLTQYGELTKCPFGFLGSIDLKKLLTDGANSSDIAFEINKYLEEKVTPKRNIFKAA